MEKIILVRYEEIFLKGLNRPAFEGRLIKNIKQILTGLGPVNVSKAQNRIYVAPESESFDIDEAIHRLTKVFGIASVSPALKIETDKQLIFDKATYIAKDILKRIQYKTFKIVTRRADKTFPMTSMDVSRELGAIVLREIPQLKVDVINPDFVLYVEIREFTYIYSEIIPGVKGLPVGTNGRATLLLSG
ncbi:MAG: tRNA 4-thiouridine(8) synthase ThiI, partial [Clostridiaceae bacterium]|nr:tRNA 4-thiouridine(8) synthase ThiI [Clostridiaceae bacterium]